MTTGFTVLVLAIGALVAWLAYRRLVWAGLVVPWRLRGLSDVERRHAAWAPTDDGEITRIPDGTRSGGGPARADSGERARQHPADREGNAPGRSAAACHVPSAQRLIEVQEMVSLAHGISRQRPREQFILCGHQAREGRELVH